MKDYIEKSIDFIKNIFFSTGVWMKTMNWKVKENCVSTYSCSQEWSSPASWNVMARDPVRSGSSILWVYLFVYKFKLSQLCVLYRILSWQYYFFWLWIGHQNWEKFPILEIFEFFCFLRNHSLVFINVSFCHLAKTTC